MNLPASFTGTARRLLGEEDFLALREALEAVPPVSIRLNPCKRPAGTASGGLPFEDAEPVPWCEAGRYLPRRPAFIFDPLLHAGAYYVQEASSMFLEQALKQCLPATVPVVMLDVCAAPGGKSTHALSLLPSGSLLVANDVIRSRAQVLAENVAKWGNPHVIVTQNDPQDFAPLAGHFDVVLADVPCSGEGLFRKDPGAISEWSEANAVLCARRQRRILADIWPCLKPGGLLLYCTCTYNTREDEENVEWACRELGAEPLPLQIPDAWGVTSSLLAGCALPVYRFFPHRTRGEGFFLAVMRKNGDPEDGGEPAPPPRKPLNSHSALPPQALDMAKSWLEQPETYEWIESGARGIAAFPLRHQALRARISRVLRVLEAGVEVAGMKGRDLFPQHGLAMSTALRSDAFPRMPLDCKQAIAYLCKEALTLPPETPRGTVLLTYRGMPLGFAKNIGNRANNLYPQAWRIRKQAVDI